MPKSEIQTKDKTDQSHPPLENHPPAAKKKCCPRHHTTKKGDRGFIEGCLAALCCCWLCEECF